jgi:hypothetical protein
LAAHPARPKELAQPVLSLSKGSNSFWPKPAGCAANFGGLEGCPAPPARYELTNEFLDRFKGQYAISMRLFSHLLPKTRMDIA